MTRARSSAREAGTRRAFSYSSRSSRRLTATGSPAAASPASSRPPRGGRPAAGRWPARAGAGPPGLLLARCSAPLSGIQTSSSHSRRVAQEPRSVCSGRDGAARDRPRPYSSDSYGTKTRLDGRLRTVLTPVKETGFAGARLAARVQLAMHQIPEAEFRDLLARSSVGLAPSTSSTCATTSRRRFASSPPRSPRCPTSSRTCGPPRSPSTAR